MKRRAIATSLVLVVVGAVAVWAWRRSGPAAPAATKAVALVARDNDVVEIASVTALGTSMDRLLHLKLATLVANLAGFDSAGAVARQVSDQLGFDPRRRDEVIHAGIDPDHRVAVGRSPAEGVTAALPAANLASLENTVSSLASARLGASDKRTEPGARGPRTVFSRAGAPVLGFETTPGFLTLFSGAGLAERTPQTVLGPAPGFDLDRAEVVDPTVFAFFPPVSRSTAGMHLDHGASAALSVTVASIELAGKAQVASDVASQLASFSGTEGDDLAARLDPDAFLVAGLGGDPASLKGVWSEVTPAAIQQMLAGAGIDVATEILGNLKPGAALSLSLPKTMNLSVMPDLDPRLTNPFQYVHLAGLGRVKDVAKARRTLERLAEAAPRFGASAKKIEIRYVTVYTVSYHLGESASFALKDDLVLVTGGAGRMEALLARLESAKPPAEVARALKDFHVRGLSVRADVTRWVEAIRSLPPAAYGVGGFAIQAAVNRWMDALAEIDRVDFGMRLQESTARANLRFSLVTPVLP